MRMMFGCNAHVCVATAVCVSIKIAQCHILIILNSVKIAVHLVLLIWVLVVGAAVRYQRSSLSPSTSQGH